MTEITVNYLIDRIIEEINEAPKLKECHRQW